jgi:hypothetical protein
MNDKEKIQFLQKLTEKEHLKYLRRILYFNFWSDDERLFFIRMYNKLIVEKTDSDSMPFRYIDNLERFFEVINF